MSRSHKKRIENLARGLRPSARTPRNLGYLITCAGAVGREGVLQALEAYTRLDTDTIADAFPYPNLFVFDKMIIICSATKIYEWVGSLVLKLTVSAGSTWRAEEFGEFVYMSNGKVAVTRDPDTKVYSLSDQPVASAICNYNGQVIIGAPGVTT